MLEIASVLSFSVVFRQTSKNPHLSLRHLENPMQTLEAMLRPKVAALPGHIQAVYVQNAAKLFATVLKSQEGNTDSTAAQETSQLMIDRLPLFVQSANLEVQERVRLKCLRFILWHHLPHKVTHYVQM